MKLLYIYPNRWSAEERNFKKFKSKRRKNSVKCLSDSFEYFIENDYKIGKCKLCALDKNVIIRKKDGTTRIILCRLSSVRKLNFLDTLSKPESVKIYQLMNQCPALISLRNQ